MSTPGFLYKVGGLASEGTGGGDLGDKRGWGHRLWGGKTHVIILSRPCARCDFGACSLTFESLFPYLKNVVYVRGGSIMSSMVAGM